MQIQETKMQQPIETTTVKIQEIDFSENQRE